jgi:membrane protease YdiL (CAAX protease family)
VPAGVACAAGAALLCGATAAEFVAAARAWPLFGAHLALQFFLIGCGEELGWRGFLVRELEPLGFWRSSFVIGFFWGLWHLPLIVNGHNYPGHPLVGPIMMTLLTIMISPLIGYVRLRARSVFAAAVFHGTLNAAAGLAIFLKGGTALLTGMTGVVGLGTLLLVDVMLWLHLRRNPLRLE